MTPDESSPPAAGSVDSAAAGEAMGVTEPSIAELLEHARLGAASEAMVSSDRCLHLKITNRAAQQEVMDRRADLQNQARTEGLDTASITAALDTLAPVPAAIYELTTDDSEGDIALVHAGHSISQRELERFGLKPDDITAATEASA